MEMVKIICLTLRWIGGWRYERMKVDEYEVATEKEVLNSDMERYKKFKYYINWKFFFSNVTFITLQTAFLTL